MSEPSNRNAHRSSSSSLDPRYPITLSHEQIPEGGLELQAGGARDLSGIEKRSQGITVELWGQRGLSL